MCVGGSSVVKWGLLYVRVISIFPDFTFKRIDKEDKVTKVSETKGYSCSGATVALSSPELWNSGRGCTAPTGEEECALI